MLPSPVSLSLFLFEGNTARYLLFSRLPLSVSFFLYTFFLLRRVFVCLIRNDRWMMTGLYVPIHIAVRLGHVLARLPISVCCSRRSATGEARSAPLEQTTHFSQKHAPSCRFGVCFCFCFCFVYKHECQPERLLPL